MRTVCFGTGGYITRVRILILTTWYPSEENPVKAVFVRRHAEALALRHDVRVLHLAPAGTRPVRSAGLETAGAPWSPGHPQTLPSALAAGRAAVREHRPDVVHTMGFSSLPFGAAAHGRLPWVHTEHWSGVTEPASAGPVWNRLRAARHLLRMPRDVTVVSSDMARQVAPFARAGHVHVVGNVVPRPAVVPDRETDSQLRLLAVGALTPVKDPELALRTVAWLRDAGHDVRLRWAGAGPLEARSRSLCHELGLDDRVELLGQLPPDQLHEHFAWSTGFLLPTRHETFCVAAAEALAHGRPVVVGAVGGQRDFVDGSVGALVADRTPAAYGRAVLDVHERLASTPAATFAAVVEGRFSPEAVADRFDEVYAAVAARA